MSEPTPGSADEVTRMLRAVSAGRVSSEHLLPLLYRSLREIAAGRIAREAPGHTLQPTALVHEAWLRLAPGEGAEKEKWENRRHFMGAAAKAMRDILVDHARRKRAAKRGGDGQRVELDEAIGAIAPPDDRVLEVHEAVVRLEQEDPRKGEIVNLRYFAGLTVAETADALGVSVGTVEREWRYIRAWLLDQLDPEAGGDPA